MLLEIRGIYIGGLYLQDDAKSKNVKDDKKKDHDRPLSPREGAEISGPMNVQHKVHVNKDFEWSGNDIFDLSEKLGEGYA